VEAKRAKKEGEEMKTAATYSRVSTEDQEREGTSLQTQLEACLKYCGDKGYNVAYRLSEAYSGLTLERPKLNELRELVRAGDIDVIVVYCLDRLSRDPTHGVILTQELEKHHVTLEAVTETVDSSELGKLISYIRGFASKLEAEKIRERTMRGKRAKVMRGELPQGTGVGMYGYEWNSGTKRREVNPTEADIVREIFTRVATGESLISIARKLNERGIATKATRIGEDKRKFWRSATIRRMVRNSGYIGTTRFCNAILTNVTPAMVSKDIFYAANAQLDKPRVRTGRPKHEYLLRNHAFCAICGKPLVGHCLNKKYRYYQCSNARPYEIGGKKCRALYIRANDLEEIVWSKTQDVLSNPNIILGDLAETGDKASLDSIDAEIMQLEKTLHKYEQRRSNLLEAMELGEFDKNEILDRLSNIKRLRHEGEARLNDLLKTREHLTSLANAEVKLSELYDRVLENLQHSTPEIKALALDALDIKVYARGTDDVEIQGVIPLELPTTARTSA
jgi:site-specific DNA recombinase